MPKVKPSDFFGSDASKTLDLPRIKVIGAKSLDDIIDGTEIAEKNMPAFWDAPDWSASLDGTVRSEPFWMRPPLIFVDLKTQAVVHYSELNVASAQPVAEMPSEQLPTLVVKSRMQVLTDVFANCWKALGSYVRKFRNLFRKQPTATAVVTSSEDEDLSYYKDDPFSKVRFA